MLLPLAEHFGEAPTALQVSVFVGCLLMLAGIIKLALGIAVDAKKLREKPTPPADPQNVHIGNAPVLIKHVDELATVAFVNTAIGRLDTAALERDTANHDRIVAVGQLMDERHKENVGHFKELRQQLDTNSEALSEQHELLRKEIRHDVGEKIQPLQSNDDALRMELREVRDEVRDQLAANNKEAAARTETVNARISTVAENMPGKILELLKTTGHLRLPGSRSQS